MPTLTLVHWLLIGNFSVLLIAAGFIVALIRQQSKETQLLEQQIQQLQQGQDAISKSAIGLGRRMKQVEVKAATAEKQRPAVSEVDNRFEQASRLAGMGASADDLIDSLGVARAEAELMVSMRQRAQTA
jgi:preprotein translocase subunit YajC|tara:strand:+ start:487 stop:873 length:387 start_codon:yes stop_codon:yes gene_type:complete